MKQHGDRSLDDAEPLPQCAYVPGGPWPRPAESSERPGAIADDRWSESAAYLRGVRLFNGGHYWEAHEAWEGLWHAHGRRGPFADLLKGLIKLAAAGVKIRQRTPSGALTHATRALALFQSLNAGGRARMLGLDMAELASFARSIVETVPDDPLTIDAPVSIVYSFRLEPKTAERA